MSSSSSSQEHLHQLAAALAEARKSPPKPTNFRVGCVIVSAQGTVLSTGYTLELPGNTHAEQCALAKLGYTEPGRSTSASAGDGAAAGAGAGAAAAGTSVLTGATLYTTMEPCSKRLSGNTPCVDRIIATRTSDSQGGGIRKVVFGAKEPNTFVQNSQSCRRLTEAGVEWEYVSGLEPEILAVATQGHETTTATQKEGVTKEGSTQVVTDVDNISPEERKRQEALPRNPKKRMMEAPLS